jgi:hypothetical protein
MAQRIVVSMVAAALFGMGCFATPAEPDEGPAPGSHIEVFEDGTHLEMPGEEHEHVGDAAVAGATSGSSCTAVHVLGTCHYHCTVNGATVCYGRCY